MSGLKVSAALVIVLALAGCGQSSQTPAEEQVAPAPASGGETTVVSTIDPAAPGAPTAALDAPAPVPQPGTEQAQPGPAAAPVPVPAPTGDALVDAKAELSAAQQNATSADATLATAKQNA